MPFSGAVLILRAMQSHFAGTAEVICRGDGYTARQSLSFAFYLPFHFPALVKTAQNLQEMWPPDLELSGL